MDNNDQYLAQAIAEARKALGSTHPNPAVGAVVVHDGEIVARGHTQPVGDDHAEIVALKKFKEIGLESNDETTLYVTLEPCSTEGRTGACTSAIIKSGIRRVVIGATDPNPEHQGRGVTILRDAGIEVASGILEEDCTDLNPIFNWQTSKGTPFIAAKIATTLDGRIATRAGKSKWITSGEARADVHRLRRYYPAIAVGAGTIMADNPSLTTRIDGEEEACPVRFVFDRNLRTLAGGDYKVYTDPWKERTILVASRAQEEEVRNFEKQSGITCWILPEDRAEALTEFQKLCTGSGLYGVLVEGGSGLLSEFLKYRMIHYIYSYRAPCLLADEQSLSAFAGQSPLEMNEAIQLRSVRQEILGQDQLMRGYIEYPKEQES